jgi:hypothetical protein
MPVRRRGNKLERWEIALVKAMVVDGRWPYDQDVLAFFTRPTRSVNHRAVAEIRKGAKHSAVKAAAPEELDGFIATWPDVDVETGLSLRGDELLIKAREAMIAAVHNFNSAGLTFRAELFIVTAVIAWTYLLHAWFKREGIDYRHTSNEKGQKVVAKTPSGAEKFWELAQCLKHSRCPVEQSAKDNLAFLIDLRHEIEHRSTNRIDDADAQRECARGREDLPRGQRPRRPTRAAAPPERPRRRRRGDRDADRPFLDCPHRHHLSRDRRPKSLRAQSSAFRTASRYLSFDDLQHWRKL